jgi:hypothetical protein
VITDPTSRRVRAEAARDLAQTVALRRLLDRLADAGLRVLVMKGAAFSHSVYPDAVRPRNDDDLLVAPEQFDAAGAVLKQAGYRSEPQLTDPTITGQQLYSQPVFGLTHFVDLHSRPLNPLAFGDLPGFDELWTGGVAIPALGPRTRVPGPVHALLLACAHRVAHHTETEHPQWLVDIDRLARVLDDAAWSAFGVVARRSRCARVCASELRRAQRTHGTPVPECVLSALSAAGSEPTARHLRSLGWLHVQWLNLRYARSWADRLALIGAHLVPPPDYMRTRFDLAPQQSLIWPYTRRVIRGASRWSRELVERLRR